ncbi:MAG: division/cell wall cluster transcriptional repressor MraZ [Patescibacteria group bacterium]
MDNLFIGEYKHQLDDKGRLAIPAKFRSKLKKGAVVTKGLDGCLFLYTADEWSKLVAKLTQMPISQGNARAFARLMLAGAMMVEIDSQGRINLPNYLIDFAQLKGSSIIAGLMSRLEIWSEKAWDAYKKKTEKESEKMAEALFI